MTNANLDDFDFLTELIRLTDAKPGNRVSGDDVARSLGHPETDPEPNVVRLRNRGLIKMAPGPTRLGDDLTSCGLLVTPDGYRFDGTGLSR